MQKWIKVVFAADMLECEECGEPFCPECNDHYADCACIGPHQDDDHEYKETKGVLYARQRKRSESNE